MAEGSKSAAGKSSDTPSSNTLPSDGRNMTSEQLNAMFQAARERPRTNHFNWGPPSKGTSPAVAMDILAEMEEEALREGLADPVTTEDERAKIRQQLDGMQSRRRWFAFMRTIEPPSNNPQSSSKPDENKTSTKTGKGPSNDA